ncbi:MAG: polyprenyl synthetase family protein [Pseudomonadota bacterium]
MDIDAQIEWMLETAVAASESDAGPPRLASAIRHAVFPGGARVRPKLCLAVAAACSDDTDFQPALAAGAAIEFLHCASLVHDDLPCFDDADSRRGKPSVHAAYGEPLAVLTGDALIAMSFQLLARHGGSAMGNLVDILGAATCPPYGIAAGQAWESEPEIDLHAYHISKTAALFIAATKAGAAAMGAKPERWQGVGEKLGTAYQIADDLRDALLPSSALGKPAHQDEKHGRPSAVDVHGLDGAMTQLADTIDSAAAAIPDCNGSDALRALIFAQAKRLAPDNLARRVA